MYVFECVCVSVLCECVVFVRFVSMRMTDIERLLGLYVEYVSNFRVGSS